MTATENTDSKMKVFVESLYANGKTPSERFGMTHEALSELERDIPQ